MGDLCKGVANTHSRPPKKIYKKKCFSCEGVQLVYQRPAPDPAGDNSAGGKRPAAVHHFPAGQPPSLTAAPALGRRPRPRVRRKGGGATVTRHFVCQNFSFLFKSLLYPTGSVTFCFLDPRLTFFYHN